MAGAQRIRVPESRVIEAWQKLAVTCNHWNVVGVDLMEGLSAATWGAHALTDWNLAAAEIGDAVLKACPRWLILVRGVGAAERRPTRACRLPGRTWRER